MCATSLINLHIIFPPYFSSVSRSYIFLQAPKKTFLLAARFGTLAEVLKFLSSIIECECSLKRKMFSFPFNGFTAVLRLLGALVEFAVVVNR